MIFIHGPEDLGVEAADETDGAGVRGTARGAPHVAQNFSWSFEAGLPHFVQNRAMIYPFPLLRARLDVGLANSKIFLSQVDFLIADFLPQNIRVRARP